MKQLKTIKRLTAFGLLVLMTACSTENTVIGNVGVSDVKSSGCKASASQLDSRPEYYNNFVGQKSVLHLTLGADNIVNARFADFMDTNCICRYDVDFKMQNIVPGSYQLEVYHTAADKQISKDNRVYSGTVRLENGKEVVLTMSR